MTGHRCHIVFSLALFLLIAIAAWPAFVAVNFALGWFMGEGSVIDLWNLEPKRNLVDDFISGYKFSAPIAITLAIVAVIDFHLLTRTKLTGFFAGIFVIIFCIALAFVYYKDALQVLPGFAITGLVLWILYKCIDIGCRLRRVG